jgi:hypothetical protein
MLINREIFIFRKISIENMWKVYARLWGDAPPPED